MPTTQQESLFINGEFTTHSGNYIPVYDPSTEQAIRVEAVGFSPLH
jgi:hypothetical protein